jgi:hypothetical protein
MSHLPVDVRHRVGWRKPESFPAQLAHGKQSEVEFIRAEVGQRSDAPSRLSRSAIAVLQTGPRPS